MLQLSTLLPAPLGARISDESALWQRVVRPFLSSLGYGDHQLEVVPEAPGPSEGGGRMILLKAGSAVRILLEGSAPGRVPELLLVLEAGRTGAGELLESALRLCDGESSAPPLVALVYPQRSGFVLALFNTLTRMPVGLDFPSPDELAALAQGLRTAAASERRARPGLEALVRELREARGSGDPYRLVHALTGLADGWSLLGQHREAASILQELKDHPLVQSQPEWQARANRDLGQALIQQEIWVEAEQCLLECIEQYARLDRKAERAAALVDLAGVELGIEQPGTALELLQEALEVVKSLGDRRAESAILNNLAILQLAEGRMQDAAHNLEMALALESSVGRPREELLTRYNLAVVYQHLGREGAAGQLIKEVRRLGAALEEGAANGIGGGG